MYIRCLFAFIIFLTPAFVKAQQSATYTIVKSLDAEWKTYASGKFQRFNSNSNEEPRAIYFTIEANHNPGSFLKCSSNDEFSLFINHQLIQISQGTLLLNLDSLSQKYSSHLQCVVFQRKGIKQLTTHLVKPRAADAVAPLVKRKPSYFFDFSIIASLIVVAYFIVLVRTLPRLATNYFNVFRLVSLQEREENLAGSRVSSTANLLFYLFGSLLAGIVLTIIFHYGSGKNTAPLFLIDSASEGFVQWIKWSTVVLLLLLLKLVSTYTLTSLFKIGDLVSFHFFNFLRLHFFVFGASALLSLGYFILRGQNPEFYSYLFYGIALTTFFWVILIYLKLLAKVPFRFFHLFSYLCISEIIPMVIIFKVLLF